MTFEHKARLRWLAAADGGRSSPPSGPTYSTVARFESLADMWPQEAWSIVLRISAPADVAGHMVAGFRRPSCGWLVLRSTPAKHTNTSDDGSRESGWCRGAQCDTPGYLWAQIHQALHTSE